MVEPEVGLLPSLPVTARSQQVGREARWVLGVAVEGLRILVSRDVLQGRGRR